MKSSHSGVRIIQSRFGDPQDVLTIENHVESRPLTEGEVRVQVSRSMIHPGDLQLVSGKYLRQHPAGAAANAWVPGLEAAGVVEDAAPQALDGTGISIGTRVAFFAPGAWQTHAIVPAASLIAIPDDLSDTIATQVLINTIIARQVLRTGLLGLSPRPRYVLQTGASSAVAKLITIFALRDGLEPIRLVRSRSSAERLGQILSGGHIVDTATEGWQAMVRRLARDELQLALDGVGGSLVGEIGALLGTKGRMISYGLLDGTPADLTLFLPKALSLIGVTIGTWSTDTAPEMRARDMQEAIAIGRTAPAIFAEFREFELTELPAAISAVNTPGKTGNVILKF
jgi:NADPH:quinone reductase-like Zn-dependent oxidoreductase